MKNDSIKSAEQIFKDYPELARDLLENPIMGAAALAVRDYGLSEAIQQYGMLAVVEADLRVLAQAVQMKGQDLQESNLSEAITAISLLTTEGRISDLNAVLKTRFPEYF